MTPLFTDSDAYHSWADTQPTPVVDPDPWSAPVVRCRRCHRLLRDPVSRARGVGPECYGVATGAGGAPPPARRHEVSPDQLTIDPPQGGGYDSSEQVDRRVVLARVYGDAIHYAQRRTPCPASPPRP